LLAALAGRIYDDAPQQNAVPLGGLLSQHNVTARAARLRCQAVVAIAAGCFGCQTSDHSQLPDSARMTNAALQFARDSLSGRGSVEWSVARYKSDSAGACVWLTILPPRGGGVLDGPTPLRVNRDGKLRVDSAAAMQCMREGQPAT
jgi:hypothetical protein